MVSTSALVRAFVAPVMLVSATLGCGGGAPAASPTSAPSVAPVSSAASSVAPAGSAAASVKPSAAGSAGADNTGTYTTDAGSTVELNADGTCLFHTTKEGLAGCTYVIRGSNIQFVADDGSQFGYIFSNGCIYAGKIGTEAHATFCKK